MTVIKDGKGTGKIAMVNSEGHLMVRSIMETDAIHTNHKLKDYYAVMSGVVTANSTNEHAILFIKNVDPNKNMYIDALVYGFNGGNTNHNRALRVKVYKDSGLPTLNNTLITPGNLNWTTSNISNTICYKWDATATDGMTMGSAGLLIYDNILAQGLTSLHISGIPILGFNNSITVSYVPEEVGNFSVVTRFFMKNDSEYNE